jgi:hypothetical protein
MFGVQFFYQMFTRSWSNDFLLFSLPEDGLPLYLTPDIPSHLTRYAMIQL